MIYKWNMCYNVTSTRINIAKPVSMLIELHAIFGMFSEALLSKYTNKIKETKFVPKPNSNLIHICATKLLPQPSQALPSPCYITCINWRGFIIRINIYILRKKYNTRFCLCLLPCTGISVSILPFSFSLTINQCSIFKIYTLLQAFITIQLFTSTFCINYRIVPKLGFP